MSQPQNPLDFYRSHSYHHILVAANNTEAIRKLAEPVPGEADNFLAAVSGATLGVEITKDSGAYLVFDSRKTSEFMVDNLKFTTLVGGNASPSEHTIISGLVQMTIIDPAGIGFFNYLKWLCDEALQTDITGVTFLLHTMFIGHTDRGQTEVVDTASVPMIMAGEFNLTQFGTDGGRYELSFAPISGMLGDSFQSFCNMPAGEAQNIKFNDSILGTAIQSLENQLNMAMRKYYFAFNPIEKPIEGPVSTPQIQSKNPQTTKRRGRMVQYMITIPPNWFYFTVSSSGAKQGETNFASSGYAANLDKLYRQREDQRAQQETAVKKSVQEADAKNPQAPAHGFFCTSVNMTIQDVLWALITQCDEVNKMSNLEAKKDGMTTIFKTLTSISSDKDMIIVHFDIVEFTIPDVNQNNNQQVTEADRAEYEEAKKYPPEGAVIFDYIFSGKNEDILHLDIKVNNLMMGLFSKANTSVSAIQELVGRPQTKREDTAQPMEKPALLLIRDKQPILPPPPSYIQYTNNASMVNHNQVDAAKQFQNKQDFHRSLSDMTAAMLQPIIKIRGNPDLFKSYIIDSVPPHVQLTESVQTYLTTENIDFGKLTAWDYSINNQHKKLEGKGGATIVTAHVKHREWINNLTKKVQNQLEQSKVKQFITGGMWVKINIFGPADYPFSQANAASPNGLDNSVRTQLFYDGWYFCSAIQNEFTASSFTQDLSLHTCDLYGEYTSMKSSVSKAAT